MKKREGGPRHLIPVVKQGKVVSSTLQVICIYLCTLDVKLSSIFLSLWKNLLLVIFSSCYGNERLNVITRVFVSLLSGYMSLVPADKETGHVKLCRVVYVYGGGICI